MSTVTSEVAKVEEKSDGRGRKALVPFPGLSAGALDAVPEDYDVTVHKPIKKDGFKTPDLWYDWKASAYEQRAAKLRDKLADIESDISEAREFANYYREHKSFPKSRKQQLKKAESNLNALEEVRELLGESLAGVDFEAIRAQIAAARASK